MTAPNKALKKVTEKLAGEDPLDVRYPGGAGEDEREYIREHKGKRNLKSCF